MSVNRDIFSNMGTKSSKVKTSKSVKNEDNTSNLSLFYSIKS